MKIAQSLLKIFHVEIFNKLTCLLTAKNARLTIEKAVLIGVCL